MITESRLQQESFTWHWNTMPEERGRLILLYSNPRSAQAGAMLKGMGLRAGLSDLLYLRQIKCVSGGLSGVLVNNEFILIEKMCHPHFLECKTKDGYQRKEQKQFQKEVEAFGWKYNIFRSLEEFQQLVKYGNL